MRRIDPDLQARLDSGATTLCRCWKVERRDGIVLGFTDHDDDLSFAGVAFRAGSGLDAAAIQSGTGLSVDNSQAMGALSSAAVTEDDIRTGRFEDAEVWQWLVDWTRPDLRVLMFRGTFGEIRRGDGAFEVELRGLTEKLNLPVGRSILKTCDRVLGDAKCGVDVSDPAFAAEAEVVRDAVDGRFRAVGLAGYADDWFRNGRLEWLTGRNAGDGYGVRTDRREANDVRLVELWQSPHWAAATGDRFRIIAGCDKRAETCRSKFNNMMNFRGFPHVPGEDWVTAYPRTGEGHDGLRLDRG